MTDLNSPPRPNGLDDDQLLSIYHRLCLIRRAEEGIAERYHEQKMRCPTHLSIGQECVPAVLSALLKDSDYAISTHRGHAHYLGKGGALGPMYAEIYGKATGCCAGKGGSMHLIDTSVGFMGTTAIVGNSIPLGVGFALAAKKQGLDRISVIFLGDGAVEEGAFYESANFAATKELPVLFVCENNQFSVYSPITVRQPEGRKIHKMVEAMSIKTNHGDGNHLFAVYEQLKSAVDYVRQTKRPFLAELDTYRWREHCGPNYDNDLGYRQVEEFEAWKLRDPMVLAEQALVKEGISLAALEKIKSDVNKEVENAFEFAEKSDWPEEAEAFTQVFANPLMD